jgi:hypothetical protein
LVERKTLHRGSGKSGREIALGMASRPPQQASPQHLLAINRGHWVIESVHHLMDWNCDEDRSRIRTGCGPQNITRLRHFVIGLLKSIQTSTQTIAELTRDQAFRTRRVFDRLRLTRNSAPGRACGKNRFTAPSGLTTVDTSREVSIMRRFAAVAQLVERNLAKVEVESSRLFCRSSFLSTPSQ